MQRYKPLSVSSNRSVPQPRSLQRSAIKFSYCDLDSVIVIVKVVARLGGSASLSDIARKLGQSLDSGALGLRVSMAVMFGLSTNQASSVFLTELGKMAADPKQEVCARVAAFLSVPLYDVMFNKLRDGVLPCDVALEKSMLEEGVSAKQVKRARQVFLRSAGQAGFFAQGKDRLIKPIF
jgi:hypothetical protein